MGDFSICFSEHLTGHPIYIYISIIFARKRECNFDWEKFTLKII